MVRTVGSLSIKPATRLLRLDASLYHTLSFFSHNLGAIPPPISVDETPAFENFPRFIPPYVLF